MAKKKSKLKSKSKPKAKKKKPAPKPKKKLASKSKAKTKLKSAKKNFAKRKTAKPAKKNPAASSAYVPAKNETGLGEVEDYFSRIGVVALTLKSELALGDSIHVHGHTTDFIERIVSMQIDHKPIQKAKKGDSVGIKVGGKARKGDQVLRVD